MWSHLIKMGISRFIKATRKIKSKFQEKLPEYLLSGSFFRFLTWFKESGMDIDRIDQD